MADEKVFRGYRKISDIAEMIKILSAMHGSHGKHKATIHLYAEDMYFVHRWPKAGAMVGFSYDQPKGGDLSIRFGTHPIELARR
jgi:hypothetical protein